MVKDNFTLTEDMMFGEAQIVAIIAYMIMFITGLTTNTMSLVSLLRERLRGKDRSKMTLLLIHLSIADLTVYLFLFTNDSSDRIWAYIEEISTNFPESVLYNLLST